MWDSGALSRVLTDEKLNPSPNGDRETSVSFEVWDVQADDVPDSLMSVIFSWDVSISETSYCTTVH